MKTASLVLNLVLMTVMIFTSCGDGGYEEAAKSKEITLGKQVWMTENLDVDKFRNGDPIPEAKTNAEWESTVQNKQPAWCYYDVPGNGERYGKLYNWYAINDSRGLAPEGWKIPSYEEWRRLIRYLGGRKVAGKKMKSTDFWAEYKGVSGNGTNKSGFSGLPGGYRNSNGELNYLGETGTWWSSTGYGISGAYYTYLFHNYEGAYQWGCPRGNGHSVRCLRE